MVFAKENCTDINWYHFLCSKLLYGGFMVPLLKRLYVGCLTFFKGDYVKTIAFYIASRITETWEK